jgi:hypothetical protein
VSRQDPLRGGGGSERLLLVLRAALVGYWAAMDPLHRPDAIREQLDHLEAELVDPVTDAAADPELQAEDLGPVPGSVEPPD